MDDDISDILNLDIPSSSYGDDEFDTLANFEELMEMGSEEEFEVESDEEMEMESALQSERRGRPSGWRKSCTNNIDEDEETDTTADAVKRKKSALIPVELLTAFVCCTAICLADIPMSVLQKMRDVFQAMNQLDRALYIVHWLRDHTSMNKTAFLIGATEVCMTAWTTVLGIPQSTYYAIRKKFEEDSEIKNAGKTSGNLSAAGMFATVWLENFAMKNGDKMPDRLGINLPCCLTKSTVYMYYKTETEGYISMTQFFRLWKSQLPHVKIPKMSRFSICDTCSKICKKLEKVKNKKDKEMLVNYREAHLRQQNLERRKYYKHITKAKQNSGKYMSVIIDAMDQDKTTCPHLVNTPKALANLWLLRMNVTGAIVHGQGIYGFFDPFKWSHGSNYTVSVLVHVLSMMTALPSTLYLQLDNCPGSNKNRYMLGFLCALVQAEVLEKVKVSFLMVGHTHEDIDQLFSRFSVWLKRNCALTVDHLMSGFEKSYQPKPTAITMNTVYNVQSWLDMNTLRNHSKPHVFKIVKENQTAVIKYKKWTTDKEWISIEGSLLKSTMDTSKPLSEISPSLIKIDERVQKDVQTVASFFGDESVSEWWKQYFRNMHDDVLQDRETSTHEIMQSLLSKKSEDTETGVVIQNEILEGLEDIYSLIPKVTIGTIKERDGRNVQSIHTSSDTDLEIALVKGNIVAVFTDDDHHEFYIMKVTKTKRKIQKQTTDDWGNSFPVGAEVIEGLYYDKDKDLDLYELLPRQRAVVYVSSVLHKLEENGSDSFVLSQAEQQIILSIIAKLRE